MQSAHERIIRGYLRLKFNYKKRNLARASRRDSNFNATKVLRRNEKTERDEDGREKGLKILGSCAGMGLEERRKRKEAEEQ